MGCDRTHKQRRKRRIRNLSGMLGLGVALIATGASAQDTAPPSWFVDFSLYPYQHTVDNDVDFTTTIRGNLPGRFSYFGYLNFKGVTTSGSAVLDRSEQNLRYSISDKIPIDLNFQGVIVRGDGNDFYQVGFGWRLHDTPGWKEFFERINLTYRMTFQLRRFGVDDNDGWAMEHFFRMTFPGVSERLYLSGFVDQIFDQPGPDAWPSNPVVGEVQLGVRLWNRFYAIGEYRVNQKRVGDEENFAAGIEYKLRW